ncbi:DUF6239 family natural product biosynthesis protein [Lentzea sp. NBRC 102530]|uniref:DUF6239 family natural product biosynthesis protein n=1 Tax=Lentzea sp. NBRC 102530 TaxID=3032201 RepID=UPI0024A41B29|nr:DUF6239 family natural product biosynthesis protein [Lentzea sp. NBRC 102530]GLY50285.1 hypothetical protein Lesp01_39410 [Lentzea sp. NBRC 102530]
MRTGRWWGLLVVAVAVLLVPLGGEAAAQHHDIGPVGPSTLGGVWLRLLTVAALVVVIGSALLRPFVAGPRSRVTAVSAGVVAVLGELLLVPVRVDRLDPRDVVLPVVMVTCALAALPLLSWSRGRVSRFLPALVGLGVAVAGTDPAAAGELLAGEWTGDALRSSALAWVAALTWFELTAPVGAVAVRSVAVVAFAVAVGALAAVPGFVAAGEHDSVARTAQTTLTSGT